MNIWLQQLLAGLPVTGLCLDSRQVKPGDVFFALSGTQTHGSHYLQEAIQRGAIAILCDLPYPEELISIPVIVVPNLKERVGEIAAEFYQHPSRQLAVFGWTGTNGKTSSCHFLAQFLEKVAMPCGLIGTLGVGALNALAPGILTTPSAIVLQEYLLKFVQSGAKACAMEVTSHALSQGRARGIEFKRALLTNVTRDHLDYHQSMENYAEAKRKFFLEYHAELCIFNHDDPYGRTWFAQLQAQNMPAFAYSIQEPLKNGLWADNIRLGNNGIQATLHSPWGEGTLETPLSGLFNLSNLLGVIAALAETYVPFEKLLELSATLKSVPGRMQRLGGGNLPLVLIDFSHTPDALHNALIAARLQATGKLFCVVGCGGERDQGKRPLMARVAEELSDHVIFTQDNSRSEEPTLIIQDMLGGCHQPANIKIELERAVAIEWAVQHANKDDVIIIAGKGHELYHHLAKGKIPYNDEHPALEALHRKQLACA